MSTQFQHIANDYNSPLTRNFVFTYSFLRYSELLDLPIIDIAVHEQGGVLDYYTNMSSWESCHNVLRERVEKDNIYFENIIQSALDLGEASLIWIRDICQKDILRSESDDELCNWYDEFFDRQSRIYAYGTTLAILDFQQFEFLAGKLNTILNRIPDEAERAMCFEVCTYPPRPSFAQEEEESLLKLAVKWIDVDGWSDAVCTSSLEEVKMKYPDFYADLEAHTDRFFWVYYVYAGPAYTSGDFFVALRDLLQETDDISQRLQDLKNRREYYIEKKQAYIEQYSTSAEENWVMRMTGEVVWAKPRRKDYQSALYAYVERLQKEVARRLHLTLRQVRSMTPDMIRTAVTTDQIDIHTINEIVKRHVCVPVDSSIDILTGTEAKQFYDTYTIDDKTSVDTNISEVNGTCAFKGNATGKVSVINRREDIGKMNSGDILVSTATTPNIIVAMKQAAAIITDEGGLTCHAAIVSRELGIPCVVGTKIATKVLKDGDRVEVDATSGIVKKI